MHVKKLVLKGFKSYKGKTVIEFKNGLNVVVGRNGSGKSNLLSALQLILADEESRRKNRLSALLNLNQAVSREEAYVELIFDNEDNFFPEDTQEVSLKRVLTGKSDKFFINEKQVKSFDNYLVQVGLAGPYAFIQQGRVTQLATMNDRTRLEMMKVISGETGWIAVLDEILKINGNSELLIESIRSVLRRLVHLKPELKDQLNELSEYEHVKNEKRAAEHVIYSRELAKIEKSRVEVQKERRKISKAIMDQKQYLNEKVELQERINLKATRWARCQEGLRYVIKSSYEKLHELEKEKAELENSSLGQFNDVATMDAEIIQTEIDKVERALQKSEPSYQELIDHEAHHSLCLKRQTLQLNQIRDIMTAKGGKAFRSENEQTKYCKDYQRELQRQEDHCREKIAVQETKIISIEEQITEMKTKVDLVKQTCETHVSGLNQLVTALAEQEQKKHELKTTKHRNWVEFSSIEEQLAASKEKLEQQHQKMGKAFGVNVMLGYVGMKLVIDTLKERENFDPEEEGYYGTVLENIECDEEFECAVQVAAGLKLFYHVVANRNVGQRLLKEFNRLKRKSEIRFIVLDRLLDEKINYPQDDNQKIPLIQHLKFREELEPAMKFVFGKTLHCINSSVAISTVKNYKLTCVTSDGDKFSSSGLMTGGHRDAAMNAITFVNERKKLFRHKRSLIEKLDALENDEKNTAAEMLEVSKSLESIETQKARENYSLRQALDNMKSCREQLANLERNREAEFRTMERLVKSLQEATDNINFFKHIADRGENIVNEAEDINKRVIADRKESLRELKAIARKLQQKSKKRSHLQGKLQNLRERMDDIMSGSQKILPEVDDLFNTGNQKRLKLIHDSISRHSEETHEFELQLNKAQKAAEEVGKTLQEINEEVRNFQDEISETELSLLKVMDKSFELDKKQDQIGKTIANVGSYPTQAHDFTNEPLPRLYQILKETNAFLNQHSAINFRAKEQYKEVKYLIKKTKTNMIYFLKIFDMISETIQDVDKHKSGICVQTLRSVQECFRKNFRELVLDATGTPGYGRFTPYGDGFDFRETHNFEDGKKFWEDDEFTGASLRVNFNNEWADDQMTDILQLSGGQKSIVALAFLLAVQATNPQSLYVFDEVDQALDPSFRESIAKKMRSLSDKAQFICTTFRREFVDYANAFVGVSFQNQSSRVRSVTRDEALDFVQPEETSSNSLTDSILASNSTDSNGRTGAGHSTNEYNANSVNIENTGNSSDGNASSLSIRIETSASRNNTSGSSC